METGLTIHKAVAPVEMRRGMLNDAAIMGALEPVEKAVFLASTEKTIDEYNGEQLTAELASTMKFVAKDVGYRITDEREFGYLVIRVAEILKRYYGNLTVKDFKMAFEMSITGELDDYLPKGRDGQADRGHYQQFNAEYVCKILSAYKAKRAYILKKANDAMPKPKPERDMDAARIYGQSVREELCKAFDFFRENNRMPEMSPIAEMLFYQLLAKAGLAPEIVVTHNEQNAILQRTINQLALKGNVGEMNQLKQAGPDAPELQYGAYALARKKALQSAFERLDAEHVELADYIKY